MFNARSLRPLPCLLVGAIVAVAACTAQTVRVTPTYTPTAERPERRERHIAVSLAVSDARQIRGEARARDREGEVVARGRQGSVIIAQDYTAVIEQGLRKALTDAGYVIDPDAPVVVDVKLRDMLVSARQFTDDNINDETGSTLDAARVLLPKGTRKTGARAILDVDVRKHDTPLGLSYYIEKTEVAQSTDPAVVGRVISTALSAAIDEAAGRIDPAIVVAAMTPVSDAELARADALVEVQQKELASAREQLNQKQQQLGDATRRIAALQRTLEEQQNEIERQREQAAKQQQTLQTELANVRRQIAADAAAAESDTARLQRDLVAREQALVQQQSRLQEQKALVDAKLKQLDAQLLTQEELDRQKAMLAEQAEHLAVRRAELDERAKELEREKLALGQTATAASALAAREKQLEAEVQALTARQEQLAAQQAELKRDRGTLRQNADSLEQWRQTLQAAEDKLATEAAQIATRREDLKKWETELAERERKLAAEPKPADQEANATKRAPAIPASIAQNTAPEIVLVDADLESLETTKEWIVVKGLVYDDRQIARTRFTVNGRIVESYDPALAMAKGAKGVRIDSVMAYATTAASSATAGGATKSPKRPNVDSQLPEGGEGFLAVQHFSFVANLQPGINRVVIEAWDDLGERAEKPLDIRMKKSHGQVHAVVIGINKYEHAPALKYAVQDATAMQDALASGLDIQRQNIIALIDEQATLEQIKYVLGDHLYRKALRDDTVVIFYSGHGVSEPRPNAADGTGVEKYLLPVGGHPDRLYSTAMPMGEIAGLLGTLPSERVIFLVDSCYSGAAGGRTVPRDLSNLRPGAIRIESMLDQVSSGSALGRVVITGSRGNEVSQEIDAFQHGAFTYFLIQGMKGAADFDRDGLVTVGEAFSYLSREVPQATNGSQHPMMSPQRGVEDVVLSHVR